MKSGRKHFALSMDLKIMSKQTKREREEERLTRYLCPACRKANKEHDTHPGHRHAPGLCDCPCRGPGTK